MKNFKEKTAEKFKHTQNSEDSVMNFWLQHLPMYLPHFFSIILKQIPLNPISHTYISEYVSN